MIYIALNSDTATTIAQIIVALIVVGTGLYLTCSYFYDGKIR
jgi:hypothetical protein